MKILQTLPLVLALGACSEQLAQSRALPEEARKPTFAVDNIRHTYLDGKTDDLATAGLGLAGLRGEPPAIAHPEAPTAAELRRRAYYENYRSLLALNDTDGYGRLFAKHHQPIAGHEYIMPVRYNDHSIASLLMVQVPERFNAEAPCLVVTASSGSRGIYGAVGVVGNWALQQGCAVATTDKGTGTGFHWLDEQQGQSVDGTLVADTAQMLHFKAAENEARRAFQAAHPARVATKHAHSGKRIEQDWGKFALQAAQFGFYILNAKHRNLRADQGFFSRANTTVLGAGISNGGAALIRAAEQDTEQWLDGLAVSEPNVFLPSQFSYQVNGRPQRAKPLPQIATESALFGPCASLAPDLVSPLAAFQLPLFQGHFANRCAQLKMAGLLRADTLPAQATEALTKLRASGIADTALPMLATAAAISLWEAYTVNYLNSYLGASVEDALCQVSYAYANAQGQPTPTPAQVKAGLFATGSGVPPASGITLINNNAKDGARSLYFSTDANGKFDLGFGAMQCFDDLAHTPQLIAQIDTLAMSGNLRGKPTLIVQGAGDNLIQVNHHGRAYATLNQRAEGGQSQLRYIEISHGQHFDALLNYAPLRAHYVPMHGYYEQALDTVLLHLRDGAPLPPNQRIIAAPVQAPDEPLASLPPIALNAAVLATDRQQQHLTVTATGITTP